MSVSGTTATQPQALRTNGRLSRVVVAALAVAVIAVALALLGWLLSTTMASPPAPKNPFGAGMREVAPSTTGIGGFILAVQAQFYKALTDSVATLKTGGTAITSLAVVGFLYGVFHAAGPGHGKGVISAYIVANGRSLARGLTLSFFAALLQAVVAIALVAVLAAALNATMMSINATARWIELASFAAVAALGAALVWRKAGQFVSLTAVARGDTNAGAAGCDHDHMPTPDALGRIRDWRDMAGVVVAAGVRPCSGAIILLVFALSQGLLWAGVVGSFAMAFGTAITTGAIAAVAVFAKSLAMRLAGGRGMAGVLAVAGLEVLAAAFVLVLGAVLLTGLWSGLPGVLD